MFKIIMLSGFLTLLFSFPSHDWNHVESRHFVFSYTVETAHLLKQSIFLAESIYDTLSGYFDYHPGLQKIAVVLSDDNDYSNGAASEALPLIEVDCRKLGIPFRGETPWLRNVLAHELSHIFSLHRMGNNLRVALFGTYGSTRTKSSGYAYTDYSGPDLPVWFVEGLSQLGSLKFGSDQRDPYRVMLLRDAWMNNRILSLRQMSHFEGTSREYELAYNQGFDFLIYLRNSKGDSLIRNLCQAVPDMGLYGALDSLCGESPEKLYEGWYHTLEARYGVAKAQSTNTHLFPLEDRPYAMEAAAVFNGVFSVANWQHDYNRFDLFCQENPNRSPTPIANDVGTCLRFDAGQSVLYYCKQVINPHNGALQFDVFAHAGSSMDKRITTGARSVTFDALNGNLVFASYHRGKTSIISASSGKRPDTLRVFSYDTAVYNIRILENRKLLLTLAVGSRMSGAVLSDSELTAIAPQTVQDMTDFTAVNGDTVLCSATFNGTPQLYWGDLKNKTIWYRLTDEPGGARFPSVEQRQTKRYLVYSGYFNGSFKLRRIPLLLQSSDSIVLPESTTDSISLKTPISEVSGRMATSNLVVGPPAINLGYAYYQYLDNDGGYVSDKRFIAGISGFMLNAPGNLTLDAGINFYFPNQRMNDYKSDYTFQTNLSKDILQTRCFGSYIYSQNNSEYETDDEYLSFKDEYSTVQAGLAFEPLYRHLVIFSFLHEVRTGSVTGRLKDSRYVYSNQKQTMTVSLGDLYAVNRYSIDWDFRRTQSRQYENLLGSAGYCHSIGFDLYSNEYDWDYWESTYLDPTITHFNRFRLDWGGCHITRDNRFSIAWDWNYRTYFGAVEDNRTAPLSTISIGGEEYFSGYAYGYVYGKKVNDLSAEVRALPFLNAAVLPGWYQKIAPGIKFEYGSLTDFLNSGSTNLSSIEYSLRSSFFIRNNRESSVYLKLAQPLHDVKGLDKPDPYQIYFGIEL